MVEKKFISSYNNIVNRIMKKRINLILIVIIVMFFVYIGVREIILGFYNQNIPVLAYHVISDKPKNDLEVSTKNFEKQMKFLYDHNFDVMSLKDVERYKRDKKFTKRKKVVITFDDGDESYYLKAFPILKKYSFPSTVFLITSRIGKKGYITSDELKILKDNKLSDIESHSYNLHNHDAAYSKNYKLYNDDMQKNKDYNFKYYAYPFGINNEVYKKALKDNGFKMSFKFSPSHWLNVNDDDYELPRVPIYNSTSLFKFVMKVLIKR